MKASELIQKLIEITSKEGQDFEVITDYTPGFYDDYHPRKPEYLTTDSVELVPEDLNDEEWLILIS